MISDIVVTTTTRAKLLDRSLTSLRECTPRDQYRLTVVQDGRTDEVDVVISKHRDHIDFVLVSEKNRGLGPSLNSALSHVGALKSWDDLGSSLTTYVQDDVVYTSDWLRKLAQKFVGMEKTFNLGFASGHDAIEHPTKKDFGNGLLLKDWIRATCMMAHHSYWMSMWPITRIDPETGRERGRPNDGMGSSVDWWFVRNHENSVCRTGRTNLVMPGLVKHLGYKDSTWLKHELPEAESDKKAFGDVEV